MMNRPGAKLRIAVIALLVLGLSASAISLLLYLSTTRFDMSVWLVNLTARSVEAKEDDVVVVRADALAAARGEARRMRSLATFAVNTRPQRERLCDTYASGQVLLVWESDKEEHFLCMETANDRLRLNASRTTQLAEFFGKAKGSSEPAWIGGNAIIVNLLNREASLALGGRQEVRIAPQTVTVTDLLISDWLQGSVSIAYATNKVNRSQILCNRTWFPKGRKYVITLKAAGSNCISF